MMVVELVAGVVVVAALLVEDDDELVASWTPRTIPPPIRPATSPTIAVCHSFPRARGGGVGAGVGASSVLMGSMVVGALLGLPRGPARPVSESQRAADRSRDPRIQPAVSENQMNVVGAK